MTLPHSSTSVALAAVLAAGLAASAPARRQESRAAGVPSLAVAVADVEAGRRTTPLVGEPTADGRIPVTFLARRAGGRAPRIVSDVTGWGEHADGTFDGHVGRMARVGHTDWYSLHAMVAPGARIEYLVAYGVGVYQTDPHNPRLVGPPPASEFLTTGYQPPQELVDPPVSPSGVMTEAAVDSRAFGEARRAILYTPPGDRAAAELPVAVFLDLRSGQIGRVLDWLVAHHAIEPLAAVFVDPHVPVMDDRSAARMRTFLAEELPAWVASRHPVSRDPGRRAIIAISFGAKDAVDTAVNTRDGYGLVGLLIPGRRIGRADIDALSARRAPRLRVAILAGQYDQANVATARAVRQAFEGAGHLVHYTEVPEGHSPRTWLHHLRGVLVSLFPPTPRPGEPPSLGEPAPAADLMADRVYRLRSEALDERFAIAGQRCGTRWATDADCLATLRRLREEELLLVADVRAHQFTDITESNYWHRGRLKFPSEIEQLLQRVGGQ